MGGEFLNLSSRDAIYTLAITHYSRTIDALFTHNKRTIDAQ